MTKILIVDDNPDVLLLLERRLGAVGYETIHANNASEGLSILETTPVDIVVLDVMMPGISGYDVLKLLKEKFETPPPVIVYSAVEDVEKKVKGDETRDYQFVVKTPSGSLLIEAIQSALQSAGRRIL
ncbi:MAG TPA: response regulator [Anaerolineales bacterium]|nr:response regulator [Anaerolineales bacterium]